MTMTSRLKLAQIRLSGGPLPPSDLRRVRMMGVRVWEGAPGGAVWCSCRSHWKRTIQ